MPHAYENNGITAKSTGSASPTSLAHNHSGEEMNMDNLRKIDRQNVGQEIYAVPETEHWAGWRDADAVQCHGTMIARRVDGIWRDAEGDRVDMTEARKYGSMRSVGISTR